MSRARNIKPALFKNEILGVADPMLTLLFEGLWLMADREGRLEDRPLRIKGELFPYRDGLDIETLLNWLGANDFITRYSVGGRAYIQVENFSKHQNPHRNEPESTIPCKSYGCTGTEKIGSSTEEIGSAPADSLSLDSLIPDSLSLDSAPAGDGARGAPKPVPKERGSRFDEFWLAYPNKTAKPQCKDKWKSKGCESVADQIIADVIAKSAKDRRWADGYIPNPLTYLNQERWNDPVQERIPQPSKATQPGKVMNAILDLENEKSGNQQLDTGRIGDGATEVTLLGFG